MLEIRDLQVEVEGKRIIDGLTLSVGAGEVHAIMGPNGSGKSTLAFVLAGRDGYEVTGGSVTLDGEDLLEMEPEERAAAGFFLAMQYPVEVPGVANMYFLRQAMNAIRRARGEEEVSAAAFMRVLREKAKVVGVKDDLLKRDLNAGFSGGEKKRNEILQLAMLEPKFAVLDETDSGLDIDALRTVADGVNRLRSAERGMIVITHYQRLLDYIVPDKVHVLAKGRIERSGGKDLAKELEVSGYVGILGPEKGAEAPSMAAAGA
jgi:Fe-S cluster assembly ATP-binding protein